MRRNETGGGWPPIPPPSPLEFQVNSTWAEVTYDHLKRAALLRNLRFRMEFPIKYSLYPFTVVIPISDWPTDCKPTRSFLLSAIEIYILILLQLIFLFFFFQKRKTLVKSRKRFSMYFILRKEKII